MEAKFEGIEELLKSLKQFPEKLQKNVLVGATRNVASEIAKEAKKNVPVDEGALKKSIGLTRRKERTKSLIGFSVSPRKDILVKELAATGLKKQTYISKTTGFKHTNYDNYGGYVEFGTSKMPAHPYLRPAFELKGEEAIENFKKYTSERIDKEIEKARK